MENKLVGWWNEDLSEMSTETLNLMRYKCYRLGGHYIPGYHMVAPELCREYTLEEIKEEMAKREHLLNKAERKQERRNLAKRQRNYGGAR